MELPNRKQRRAWAKQMGLLKKKAESPFSEQIKITRRAQEAGKQIHLRNVERMLEKEEKDKEAKDLAAADQKIGELLDQGVTIEEAMKIASEKNDSEV